ncbi:hypothetical protein GCM10027610_061800 [Dactylosporangium cerinum]
MPGVEPVDRLDQAQVCDLREVVEEFAAVAETLRQVFGQRQVHLDEPASDSLPVGASSGRSAISDSSDIAVASVASRDADREVDSVDSAVADMVHRPFRGARGAGPLPSWHPLLECAVGRPRCGPGGRASPLLDGSADRAFPRT